MKSIETLTAEIKADKAREAEQLRQAQKAKEAEIREESRRRLLDPAMAAFLASGGTMQEWEREAPAIEKQLRQKIAVDAAGSGETPNQALIRRQYHRNF